MNIWQIDNLLLFIGFVIPGFVSLKTYQLLFPSATRDSSRLLIDAIAYSCVNYAVLFYFIYEVESSDLAKADPRAYVAFYVLVLLIAPVAWALLLRVLRGTQFLQRVFPHPTGKPWDFVFGQRKSCWMIVALKDGTRVAGKFGPSSFASSAPAAEQLYLEENWVINDDGGFERPRADTGGILILSSDIVTVELFKMLEESVHERKETTQ